MLVAERERHFGKDRAIIRCLLQHMHCVVPGKRIGFLPHGHYGPPDSTFSAPRIGRPRPQPERFRGIHIHPAARIVAQRQFIHRRNMTTVHARTQHLDRLCRRQERLFLEQQSIIPQTEQCDPDILGLMVIVTRLCPDVCDDPMLMHQTRQKVRRPRPIHAQCADVVTAGEDDIPPYPEALLIVPCEDRKSFRAAGIGSGGDALQPERIRFNIRIEHP